MSTEQFEVIRNLLVMIASLQGLIASIVLFKR